MGGGGIRTVGGADAGAEVALALGGVGVPGNAGLVRNALRAALRVRQVLQTLAERPQELAPEVAGQQRGVRQAPANDDGGARAGGGGGGDGGAALLGADQRAKQQRKRHHFGGAGCGAAVPALAGPGAASACRASRQQPVVSRGAQ